jgi:hypothetical protein
LTAPEATVAQDGFVVAESRLVALEKAETDGGMVLGEELTVSARQIRKSALLEPKRS